MTVKTSTSFELGGTNGAAITAGNTGATDILGSGSCTIITTGPKDGTRCMLIDGITRHVARWQNATTTNVKLRGYYTHLQVPGANAGVVTVYAANGTTVAFQLHVLTTGRMRIRDSDTGSTGGGSAVDAGFAMVVGQRYRVHIDGAGAGNLNLQMWGPTTDEDATTTTNPPRLCNVTCTLGAVSFGFEEWGLTTNLGAVTPLQGRWDFIESDDTNTPAPFIPVAPPAGGNLSFKLMVGGAAKALNFRLMVSGTPKVLNFQRQAPTPPVVGGPHDLLVPDYGIWHGVESPGSGGQEDAASMGRYRTALGGVINPQVGHWYLTNAFTAMSSNMMGVLHPTGSDRRMANITWKISRSDDPQGAKSWSQIANGACDARIRTAARVFRDYGYKLWLGFHHEPEGDGNNADYAPMYNHARSLFLEEGADNIVWAVNFMGYPSWKDDWMDLYPGDSSIDWIFYDPYAQGNINTAAELLNNILGTSGFAGFYNWATTPKTGFAGNKWIGLAEWGFDRNPNTGITDQESKELADDLRAKLLSDYPRLKCMIYWDNVVSGAIDSRISASGYGNTYPLAITALKALYNSTAFQVPSTSLYP